MECLRSMERIVGKVLHSCQLVSDIVTPAGNAGTP